jgi:hypothetical protein
MGKCGFEHNGIAAERKKSNYHKKFKELLRTNRQKTNIINYILR